MVIFGVGILVFILGILLYFMIVGSFSLMVFFKDFIIKLVVCCFCEGIDLL